MLHHVRGLIGRAQTYLCKSRARHSPEVGEWAIVPFTFNQIDWEQAPDDQILVIKRDGGFLALKNREGAYHGLFK